MNRRQFIATVTAALGATHVKAFLPVTTSLPDEFEIYYETKSTGGRGWIICPPDKVKHYIRFIRQFNEYHIVSIKPVNKPKCLAKWSYTNV